MGFWFGDTEKIEKGEVTREMEREMRFRKDGDREREREEDRTKGKEMRERQVSRETGER